MNTDINTNDEIKIENRHLFHSHEDNKFMWDNLNDVQKKEIYRTAESRFPYLRQHFECQNVRLSNEDFTESSCFDLLMELIGRKETKRTKLPGLPN